MESPFINFTCAEILLKSLRFTLLSPQRWTKISAEFYFIQINEIERAIATQNIAL